MTSKLWRAAAIGAVVLALAAGMVPQAARAASPDKAAAPQVTANPSGGLTVSIDPRTGRIRPITPQEARQLVAGMSQLFSRAITAQDVTQYADGTISVDLSGSFQNVYLARLNPDGSVGQACVDNAAAAYEFFAANAGLEDK
jgi:hypothetical protein